MGNVFTRTIAKSKTGKMRNIRSGPSFEAATADAIFVQRFDDLL
jgi:hypothetical protein